MTVWVVRPRSCEGPFHVPGARSVEPCTSVPLQLLPADRPTRPPTHAARISEPRAAGTRARQAIERKRTAWQRRRTGSPTWGNSPYVERALKDEELRENVRAASTAAREVYNELLGNRGVTGLATRVASDKDIQENLRRRSTSCASDRPHPGQGRPRRPEHDAPPRRDHARHPLQPGHRARDAQVGEGQGPRPERRLHVQPATSRRHTPPARQLAAASRVLPPRVAAAGCRGAPARRRPPPRPAATSARQRAGLEAAGAARCR